VLKVNIISLPHPVAFFYVLTSHNIDIIFLLFSPAIATYLTEPNGSGRFSRDNHFYVDYNEAVNWYIDIYTAYKNNPISNQP